MNTNCNNKNEKLVNDINQLSLVITNHLELANQCLPYNLTDILEGKLTKYSEILQQLNDCIEHYKNLLQSNSIHPNCVQYFVDITQNINANLPYIHHDFSETRVNVRSPSDAKRNGITLTSNIAILTEQFDRLNFLSLFFEKLGYFETNVTAIGANGSGKSSIVTKLKDSLKNEGVIIPAQKILLIEQSNSISNPSSTATTLKQFQTMDKSSRTHNIGQIEKEFGAVIDNLLADNNSINNKYRQNALIKCQDGAEIDVPTQTNLDKAISIWNSLIEHREMSCEDGFNITLADGQKPAYSANLASDGEKVLLFIIGHVLQAPENGFIVVDEPEMYLNKSILSKIWDKLEQERSDCVFIYLTHDVDFATSRKDSKKLWIKSFSYPEHWDIEEIPENILPEALTFELLGSRKNILFCEGLKGSNDEKILNILFPNLTIKPVESCENVINYTKALNNIDAVQISAIGLIDSDHHPIDRLTILENQFIYSFSVAEIENLLLDEELLIGLSERLMFDTNAVNTIKDNIINQFSKDIELQVSNFVSAKIDFLYKSTNFKQGNNLQTLHKNFDDFNGLIDIETFYNQRVQLLTNLTEQNEYEKIIKIYNNKGLKRFCNKSFAITDFTSRMIKFIKENEFNQTFISRYFPQQIIDANNL